tara:strand:+ start:429 stop:569 length:141 start_codon:yes stop_codon:yes gene_type:complete
MHDDTVGTVSLPHCLHAGAMILRFFYYKPHGVLLRFPFDGSFATDT